MALSCITAVLWYRIISVIKSLEGSVGRKSLARFLVMFPELANASKSGAHFEACDYPDTYIFG